MALDRLASREIDVNRFPLKKRDIDRLAPGAIDVNKFPPKNVTLID